MFTMLAATMTFSSGLPILYIIATIFYALAFGVNKVLLLYHYEKTVFSEQLRWRILEVGLCGREPISG